MKKTLFFLALASQLILVLSGGVIAAKADTFNENQTSVSQVAELDNIFALSELGYTERILTGPYDSVRVLFGLPPTWRLTPNSTLNLTYNFAGGSILGEGGGQVVGGTLRIFFNDVLVDTIYLGFQGDITKVIPIPIGALEPVSEDGRYLLTFIYDASVNCDLDYIQSSMIISERSELNLDYQAVAPPTDLSKFPRPLYQPQSVVSTKTSIVLPDEPTTEELESVMAVAAGLGAMTGGDLDVELVPVSQLTEETRKSNNLIFVGLPGSLKLLSEISWPVSVKSSGISLNGLQPDDGVLQMMVSPWNAANVITLVSGNSAAAVLKAAQSLGSSQIVTSLRPDVSIISSANPTANLGVIAEDQTLADLGYENFTLGGFGGEYVSYEFMASAEQVISTDAYVDLVTSHSNLLNFNKSGVTVILNGNMLGSVTYADDAEQITTTRLKMLPGFIRRGANRLEIIGDLAPLYICYSPDLNSTWVTIGAASLIHMPSASQPVNIGSIANLGDFPELLLTDRNLSDLAVVVPTADPIAWNQAMEVVSYLGDIGSVGLTDIRVAYGDDVPEEIRTTRNLLVFGQAENLPLIDSINDMLPAPFAKGTNEAVQPAMLVNYRLLPGVSVGYIQLLSSPWNPQRLILAVMGNTQLGIPMAGQALVTSDALAELNGNFAILYGDQILSTDTRLGPSKEGLAGEVPSTAATVTPLAAISTPLSGQQNEVEISGRADWLIPAIVGIAVVMIGMAIFLLRGMFANKVSEKPADNVEG